MNEPESFLNRISRLFKRTTKSNGNTATATLDEDPASSDENEQSPHVSVQTHAVSLRPWRRNTAAIAQLQGGFHSLTNLMNEIRQNMVNQGRRQDELNSYLSALPKLLETIPESNRIQGETLKAIQEQLQHNADQQQTLGEILEKLSESGGDQKDLLEGLRERVETLNHQDKAMADSLNSVGAALESTSRNSAAGAQVLESLRENLKSRDGELERVLQRQGVRFTTLLAVAIFVSITALVAVVVMGYLMMHGGMK
jgi:small-conductance mechanosensitive channel